MRSLMTLALMLWATGLGVGFLPNAPGTWGSIVAAGIWWFYLSALTPLLQLLVIVVLVPALSMLFRFAVAERAGTILLSVLVAHTAWHWMTERGGELLLYDIRFGLPAFDLMLLAAAMRWGMLVLIVAMIVWLMSMVFPQLEQDGDTQPVTAKE